MNKIRPLKSKTPSQIYAEFDEWFKTTIWHDEVECDGSHPAVSAAIKQAALDAWFEVEKRQLQKRYESAYNSILMETKGT